MKLAGAIVGALVATAIGMVVWVGVGMAGYEVGFIAWGIGFAAGLGATVGAGQNDTALNGILAALIAVLGIVGAKYITISMAVDRELSGSAMDFDFAIGESDMIGREADAIITADGKEPGEIYDENLENGYPDEYWNRATEAWMARSAEERETMTQQSQAEMEEFQELMTGSIGESVKSAAFKESFSPFDALWFFLAAATAFRVGSGAQD